MAIMFVPAITTHELGDDPEIDKCKSTYMNNIVYIKITNDQQYCY